MCRSGAKQITTLAAEAGKPVRLTAIAKEHLGNEEFVEKFWPAPAELYFDEPKKLPAFNECNGQSQGIMSGFGSYLVGGAVANAVKKAKDEKVEGNMKGEGLVLGSVLVVSSTGELLLHHKEKTWGDHPSDAELRDAIARL